MFIILYFQAIGRKRWYFLDPKYSAYMHPLRGGKVIDFFILYSLSQTTFHRSLFYLFLCNVLIRISFLRFVSFMIIQVNMMTGSREMSQKTDYLPLQYADLNPGDMLYNPDWQWHTIQNYEGLSIGVPIREVSYLCFYFL